MVVGFLGRHSAACGPERFPDHNVCSTVVLFTVFRNSQHIITVCCGFHQGSNQEICCGVRAAPRLQKVAPLPGFSWTPPTGQGQALGDFQSEFRQAVCSTFQQRLPADRQRHTWACAGFSWTPPTFRDKPCWGLYPPFSVPHRDGC